MNKVNLLGMVALVDMADNMDMVVLVDKVDHMDMVDSKDFMLFCHL